MPIIESRFQWGIPQANGKRFIEELHTDEAGNVYRFEYGPMGDEFDPEPVMRERAEQLAAQIEAGEAPVPFMRGVV